MGQPLSCKIWTVQEPELIAKMPRKCLFQDRWLKDIAYLEWVLKDKLDKTLCSMRGIRNSANFFVFLAVVVVLTKSNIGPYKSL